MRSWQIIIIGAATASITVAALLLYGGAAQQADPKLFLFAHLPRIAVAWFSFYGLITLAATTGAEIINRPRPVGHDWLRHYAARLAAVQYFTSLIALLGVGLAFAPIASILSEPGAIRHSPALLAGGGLGFAGLIGALVLAIAMRTGAAPRPPAQDMQVRLLNEVLELLRAEPRHGTSASELAQLAREIVEGQRSTLAVVKDLATAVNRLRRSLDEIKRTARAVSVERDDNRSAAAAETAANDLRAAAGTIDAAVRKLAELADALYAREMTAEGDPSLPPGRIRVSGDLQALLREITPREPEW
jgi:hypothetical protein